MAATQFNLPYQVAVKPTNVGCPNASFAFYLPGTTELTTVYADAGLTVPLENPVIADGAGRLPAIYLDNALNYRLYALDKAGALLIDRDPYIPGEAPDSASLQPYQDAAATSASRSAADAAAVGAALATIEAALPANFTTDELLAGLPVNPRWFGAAADGVTDDAAALQAALDTGRRVWIQAGLTYAFGSQLRPPSGGGFVGHGTLLMLTGAGKFDKADYTGAYTEFSGIHIEGVSNVRIEARITLQTTAAIRTHNAIGVWNSTNVHLDVEEWGFQETFFGIIEWNSNVGGSVRAFIHDCTANSTALPDLQITGLSIDNNRLAGVNSTQMRFDVHAKDIYLGAAALALYGIQTDGVNIQGQGKEGHIGTIRAENVYEPLDCFSDHNIVQIHATNCYWGVKLIHGASNNIIHATVDLYQKAGCVFSTGQTSGYSLNPGVDTKPVSHNQVHITATRGGEIGAENDACGVLFDGSGGDLLPEHNVAHATVKGDGTHLKFGADIGASANNSIYIEASGYATNIAQIRPGLSTGNVVHNERKALVEAYCNAQSVAPGSYVVLQYANGVTDRTGEFNASTYTYTATSERDLLIIARYRTTTAIGGKTHNLAVFKNGAAVATNEAIVGASTDFATSIQTMLHVTPGDTVSVRLNHNESSAFTITSDAALSGLRIMEL